MSGLGLTQTHLAPQTFPNSVVKRGERHFYTLRRKEGGLLEFEFDFDPRYRYLLRPLGVHAGNSYVGITDDDEFVAKFGRWQIRTSLANIAGYQRSGGYRWWKAIGVRGSMADHGLTFGSNTRQGLCVEFIEKIPALVAGPRHPGLTVTVADVDSLAAALESHGIGERPS